MGEPGIKCPANDDPVCDADSPGGWACCLPPGHDGNHIGVTQNWGTLHQWPQDKAPGDG